MTDFTNSEAEFVSESKTPTHAQALSRRQVIRAAAIVLLGFLASGILGLIRTAAFNAMFGASAELEAFYAAQRIPELLFTLVAGGALGSSFIPVYSKLRTQGDHEQGWRLASSVMTLSALAAAVLGLVLALTAPLYVPIFYSRVEYIELAINLTRIMLTTTVIFSISGLLMGILNTHQNFLLPSMAISMNNIGLILGALLLAPLLSTQAGIFAYTATHPTVNVYGLAMGAVLGALLHLVVQLPGLRGIHAQLRFLPNPRIAGVRQVLKLMLPRMLGLAVTQINFLVNTAFATMMVVGSLNVLNNAWYLMFFALGVIAQSVGTAVFPSLSALAAANDMQGYKDRLAGAMRSVLFLAFPVMIGYIVMGQPIVTLLFEHGAFTSDATAGTAWALAFFALGIAGHSLLEVLSRAFYALSDTRTPVLIGIISMVSNIILNVVFIRMIGNPQSLARGAFAGLALANSLTTLIEGAALWIILSRRIGGINDAYVLRGATRTLAAASGMGAALWVLMAVLASSPTLVVIIVGGLVALISFGGLALLLRIEEAQTIPGLVLRRFKRS